MLQKQPWVNPVSGGIHHLRIPKVLGTLRFIYATGIQPFHSTRPIMSVKLTDLTQERRPDLPSIVLFLL